MKILRDWFTGPKNDHYELGRALWALGTVSMLCFTGWHLYLNGEFDVASFGIAFGGILAAGGFGIAAKDKGAREPQQ